MVRTNEFLIFIAENVNEEANIEGAQKIIFRLSRMLGLLHIKETRENFCKLARPVFAEILSWEKGEEELITYKLPIRLEDYEPAPGPPIRQYIAIALYIGFQIGYLIKNQSSVENELREKALLQQHQPIFVENARKTFGFKVDFFEISFLIFCLLFLIASIIENRNFFTLRLRLLVKTFKGLIEKRKKEDSLLPLKPSSLLFEIYG